MRVCGWISTAAFVLAAGLLLSPVPVIAHHSAAAAYDSSKTVEAQGTITKVLFKNPHGFVFVEATDEKGQKVEWLIEMGGSTSMFGQGWTKEMLAPGTVVKFVGNPSRAPGSHGMTAAKFSTPDGTPIGPQPGGQRQGAAAR